MLKKKFRVLELKYFGTKIISTVFVSFLFKFAVRRSLVMGEFCIKWLSLVFCGKICKRSLAFFVFFGGGECP